jgi:predicted metal-binding protein
MARGGIIDGMPLGSEIFMKQKITLMVCRSCIVQNSQEDSCLKDEASLRQTYEKKLKTGFFGARLAELQIVDCLTNCENPNSVQINREDGEMLFGFIRSEKQMDELIELVKKLRDSKKPLAPSEALKKNLTFVRPHREWRKGKDAFHADRIPASFSPDSDR